MSGSAKWLQPCSLRVLPSSLCARGGRLQPSQVGMGCLHGLHILFASLRDFPYLNGEPRYVEGCSKNAGRDQLLVRVVSLKAKSVQGCPHALLLDPSRLVVTWLTQTQQPAPQAPHGLRRHIR